MERLFSPVSGLSLIYLDPDTDLDSFPEWLERSEETFTLGFTPKLRPVELQPESYIEELLQRAEEIHAADTPPEATPGCRDCQAMEKLMGLAELEG